MTIKTKFSSDEKKADKPLVTNDQLASAPPFDDAEAQNPNVMILRARARRVSSTTTLCLLLTSLIVVSVGIFGGRYLYHQYISAQLHRFKGPAQIPLELTGDDNGYDNANDQSRNFFHQDFEIDVDEKYEKIDVPDFRDGRSGRFIHDFNTNITGIIDITGNRCFVMPLNRGNVLPPRSLFDLIHKMWDGYYKVDTRVVRETMRVVTPPLKDLKGIGTYIAKECENRPVYKLEKYVGGVVKRSADMPVEAKFAQFSGNKVIEVDIVNLDDALNYEGENQLH